jgi:hypothetical protein
MQSRVKEPYRKGVSERLASSLAEAVARLLSKRRQRGAADKAASLARRKSAHRQLPVFGRLAYPVRAAATKHAMPGRKSLSCPEVVCAAVGAIWETSKLGGLNIKECLQRRKTLRGIIVFAGEAGSRPTPLLGEADDTGEETGERTRWDRRGKGPGIRRKIRRDNVGKVPRVAGAGSNRQRLLERS